METPFMEVATDLCKINTVPPSDVEAPCHYILHTMCTCWPQNGNEIVHRIGMRLCSERE